MPGLVSVERVPNARASSLIRSNTFIHLILFWLKHRSCLTARARMDHCNVPHSTITNVARHSSMPWIRPCVLEHVPTIFPIMIVVCMDRDVSVRLVRSSWTPSPIIRDVLRSIDVRANTTVSSILRMKRSFSKIMVVKIVPVKKGVCGHVRKSSARRRARPLAILITKPSTDSTTISLVNVNTSWPKTRRIYFEFSPKTFPAEQAGKSVRRTFSSNTAV